MIPDELKRRYKQGHVIPFVGAGASMSVTWKDAHGVDRRGPSWRELVDWAAREIGFEVPDLLRMRASTDLQILEYFKIKKGAGPLNHWLSTSLRPDEAALRASRIHTALANLKQCSLFYTTNFEDLLERSLELAGRKVSVVTREADHIGKRGGTGVTDVTEVVKFHGDLKHPETMVLSESDYQQRLSFSKPMDFRLLSDLLNRVILFIGYSFSDPNVSYLFYRLKEMLNAPADARTGVRAYILVADPSDFEHQLFKSRQIEVIRYDGADHTAGVSSLLEELAR
jgi:hypothetical protein